MKKSPIGTSPIGLVDVKRKKEFLGKDIHELIELINC